MLDAELALTVQGSERCIEENTVITFYLVFIKASIYKKKHEPVNHKQMSWSSFNDIISLCPLPL